MQSNQRKLSRKARYREEQRAKWAQRLSRSGYGEDKEESAASHDELHSAAPARSEKGWRGLCRSINLRWVLLALILAAGNQLTGINAVIYYAPRIFVDAGFESRALVLTIAVVGVWNLVSVLISMPLIRHFPRRTLMLVATGIMTLGVALMAVSSAFFAAHRAIPSILAILLFVFGFELGPGPLFFVLAAEAFPSPILHAGLSLSNQMAWLFNVAVSFLFPLMNVALGTAGTFGVFVLINIAVLLAYTAALPRHVEHTRITAPSASPIMSSPADTVTPPLHKQSPPHAGANGTAGGVGGVLSPVVERDVELALSPQPHNPPPLELTVTLRERHPSAATEAETGMNATANKGAEWHREPRTQTMPPRAVADGLLDVEQQQKEQQRQEQAQMDISKMRLALQDPYHARYVFVPLSQPQASPQHQLNSHPHSAISYSPAQLRDDESLSSRQPSLSLPPMHDSDKQAGHLSPVSEQP
jgi:hypothetical protein